MFREIIFRSANIFHMNFDISMNSFLLFTPYKLLETHNIDMFEVEAHEPECWLWEYAFDVLESWCRCWSDGQAIRHENIMYSSFGLIRPVLYLLVCLLCIYEEGEDVYNENGYTILNDKWGL